MGLHLLIRLFRPRRRKGRNAARRAARAILDAPWYATASTADSVTKVVVSGLSFKSLHAAVGVSAAAL